MKSNLHYPLYASVLLALASSASPGQTHSANATGLLNSAAAGPAEYSSSVASLPDAPSYNQQVTSPPQMPGPPPRTETQAERQERERREEGEREVKKAEKQRAGGVLPLFNVVISGKTVPLTPKEKFDLSYHTIIDPYTIGLAVVAGGGIGELEDSHTGYHHGPLGLGKRIGASYADNAIGNVVGNAALPVILHQDPRYYRKGEGKVLSRIYYSAITSFICYGDNGKKQFNTSNILGNLISGGISNVYYPSDERGFELTVQNAFTVTLEGMIGAQLLEFSPDFNAYMQRRRQRKLDRQAAGTPSSNQPALSKP